jgi:hypothetical protein
METNIGKGIINFLSNVQANDLITYATMILGGGAGIDVLRRKNSRLLSIIVWIGRLAEKIQNWQHRSKDDILKEVHEKLQAEIDLRLKEFEERFKDEQIPK